MKRRKFSCPTFRRTCVLLPGIIFAAAMLAIMIVHMEAAFTQLQVKPVFSIYPQSQNRGTIFFPHAIHGTDLVAERITAYSGPYIEDGTNDAVNGIAALTLSNRGTQPLECARIELQQGTRRLVFQAHTILPGDTVIVLEESRQVYEKSQYTACTAKVVPDTGITAASNEVRVSLAQNDAMLIKNQTDRVLCDVCIAYKYWLDEQELYIGGITFYAHIDELLPGQMKQISVPDLGDNSRIIRITYQ